MLNTYESSLRLTHFLTNLRWTTSYAKLDMGNLEKKHILPLLQEKSSLFLHFIYNIFFVWNETVEELESFLNRVNMVHPTIKFESNYSHMEINFLDTTLKITSNIELITMYYINVFK